MILVFIGQVLNKNYLLTDQGRKEALQNIDDYLASLEIEIKLD